MVNYIYIFPLRMASQYSTLILSNIKQTFIMLLVFMSQYLDKA